MNSEATTGDYAMVKIAGKGFGGGTLSLILSFTAMAGVKEWLQIVSLTGSIVVIFWTIWSLSSTSRRNAAEEIRANADTERLHAETSKAMLVLCAACREGRVPVNCPLPADKRPEDCPQKHG